MSRWAEPDEPGAEECRPVFVIRYATVWPWAVIFALGALGVLLGGR
jgi:hypothetical protein